MPENLWQIPANARVAVAALAAAATGRKIDE
jgi:hypothetical protein